MANLTVARGGKGVQRLRSNYAMVRPELDDAGLDALVRDDAPLPALLLRGLPAQTRCADDLADRVRVEGDGPVREVIDGGGSVIAFLGHLGNWDLAGAWGTCDLGPVTRSPSG